MYNPTNFSIQAIIEILGGGSIGDSTESGSMETPNVSIETAPEGGLRTSKSDTSLTESFVVVSSPVSPALAPKPKPPITTIDTGTRRSII